MVSKFEVGSLLKREDRLKAARLVAEGEVVGVFNRGVCALWFDGGNPKAIRRIAEIKGDKRGNRPIALTLSLSEFIPMIDMDKLPKELQDFLLLPDLKSRIGSLCFIRAPIHSDYLKSIPSLAKSFESSGVCMVQNWDSFGHTPTEDFLNRIKKSGVLHPAVTSMNRSGEPEIVDQKAGADFCLKEGVTIFLTDPKAHRSHIGSYTIFTFGANGIKLERDGNIPSKLFKYIFGIPIDTKSARPAKHPQLKFPTHLLRNLHPTEVREAILRFLVQ